MENSNGVSKRMMLIGSLKDIRLSLSVKRIISPKIKKEDLKTIVDSAKEKLNDDVLSKRIDKMFDEYFVQVKSPKDNVISLNAMENMLHNNDGYKDNEGQGISFVKRDSHFKSSTEGKKDAA